MHIDLAFSIRVQRLAVRDGLTISAIAARLNATPAAVTDALIALAVPLPGEIIEVPRRPSADERAAMIEKMPKRIAERIQRNAKDRT
jgi:hypothetical protein